MRTQLSDIGHDLLSVFRFQTFTIKEGVDLLQVKMASSVLRGPAWLPKVIKDFSTNNYRIEYGGFLSNHILHGIVAIAHLGGSEERAREYANWYVKHRSLEQPMKDDPARSGFEEVVKERPNFGDLMDRYKALVASEGSIGAAIKKEFPWLGKGIVSSLFHGLIHLGYGAGCGSDDMMLEGLSYLHWAYEPLRYSSDKDEVDVKHFGKGNADIIGVLVNLQKDTALMEKISAFTADRPTHGLLQSRYLGIIKELPDYFVSLANSVKLPEFFDPDDYTQETVEKLALWLVIQVLTVYCKSERENDFVLLHGVTASWGMRHVVPYLSPADGVVAIRDLLALVLATYVVERCSPLSRDLMVLDKPSDLSTWEEYNKKTLSKRADEHVYKIVQVCYDMWKDDDLKGEPYDSLFATAVHTVLGEKFRFVGFDADGTFPTFFP